jgi:BASS family bile acid:Na+ symporter
MTSKRANSAKTIYWAAALCFAAAFTLYFLSYGRLLALPACLGFLALSLALKRSGSLGSLSFTMLIFAAVSITLAYPESFTAIGDFKTKKLITPLIQIIMFGMGTEIGLRDFRMVAEYPKGVLIGLFGHFTFMPLMGFALAKLFGFEPEVAAGVVLIGSMPCGVASNVMSYLAKANLALSITLTTISTLLATFLTPFWMKVLGGQFVEVNAFDMFMHIVEIVVLPIGAGLLFNRFVLRHNDRFRKYMPLVSMFGIVAIIIVITAMGSKSLLTIGPVLILASFIHNVSGLGFGYWVGKLFGLSERDRRTIAIEVGMQNGGLASGLAEKLGKAATMGLAPAVFGPFMNITGSILASYWHKREPEVSEQLAVGGGQ